MLRRARTVGIAIGSLAIAYLAVGLVAGIFLGAAVRDSPLVGVVIVVLGGLVFADIMRRDRPRASRNGWPDDRIQPLHLKRAVLGSTAVGVVSVVSYLVTSPNASVSTAFGMILACVIVVGALTLVAGYSMRSARHPGTRP
jgi:uncharacterized membrane protein YedE/YeeE